MSLPLRAVTGASATLMVLGLATPAVAQQEACGLRATHPSTTTYSSQTASLPVDRINDLLVLGPGVTATDDGLLNIRNAGPGGNALYVDGVPVMPGLRAGLSPTLGGSYLVQGGPGVAIGTNGFRQLSLTAGLTPLDRGNAIGGIIEVETAPCGSTTDLPSVLRAGIASDAMFGANNGLGYNRFTIDGLARAGRLEFGGAAVVEGQKSNRLGMNQNDSPIYVQDGIDTTVTFDGGAGDVSVPVSRFRASDGIRIPRSAQSSYTVSGQATYYLGERHRLRVSGLASQQQGRVFSYEDLYNPRQTFGQRYWSQVVTGSWFGRLAERGTMRLSAEAHASLQWDHGTEAPLVGAGELASRDPRLGLLLSPLKFRFDQSNFPVNAELIHDFRTNIGRLSPYDLTNTTQYQPIDQIRNNAYGLTGFTEGGGPVGTLTLYDEKRLVGQGSVTAEFAGRHRIRAGLEATRYDVKFYTSRMTSQAFSGAFIEHPKSVAAFAEYQLTMDGLTVTGGLRYDRFKSGASRAEFPRISSMPGYDPADPTALFVEDEAHNALTPRFTAFYQASPRFRFFGGYTGLAQVPDFSFLFAGINTDLAVTNTQDVFGTDLDFQRSGIIEVGADYLLGARTTLAGTVWTRTDQGRLVGRLTGELDPFRGSFVDIRRIRNGPDATTTGIDLRLTRALGQRGQMWLSYGFVSPDSEVMANSRRHNVAATVLYETGPDGTWLGGLLRNTGVYGTLRYASGTPYTRCPEFVPNDDGVLSPDRCTTYPDGEVNGARLSALKMLDLRVTRGFRVGRTELVAFADARNLLNLETIRRVFAQTGTTRNDRERLLFRAGNLSEYANEAEANGVRLFDDSVDLSFSGATDPRAACGNWTNASGSAAAPNCVYLINAESRFGNGDHVFTVAEQTRAIDAYYYVARGEQNFTAPGRRVRLGAEVRF